jgi:hypothetical protein
MTDATYTGATPGIAIASKDTTYVVLKAGEGDHWKVIGVYDNASAHAAVRDAAEEHGAGDYVAVPARSWKPVKATLEKTTVVKLG